jgi:hypothetical protein
MKKAVPRIETDLVIKQWKMVWKSLYFVLQFFCIQESSIMTSSVRIYNQQKNLEQWVPSVFWNDHTVALHSCLFLLQIVFTILHEI